MIRWIFSGDSKVVGNLGNANFVEIFVVGVIRYSSFTLFWLRVLVVALFLSSYSLEKTKSTD